ncbi:LOG family protein [Oryzobacter terrae]|uniref:LOG family protein n=1 Tax=Oryzobacter terrae TaxID=1620385 RepID=UPI00366D4013
MREIESLPDLGATISGGGSLRGLRLQDLDLTGHEDDLLARSDVEGMVVLGGTMSDALAAHLRGHGALVFPGDPHAPVNPYRSTLYQPHELYAGLREHGYAATPDSRAYHWARDGAVRHDAFVTLLRAIHDDSMGDALDEVIGPRAVAGVMGGHAVERGTDRYAGAALLGHALADAGLTVVTGGGPGAMEAANLGALAPTADALTEALARLAPVPSFRPDVGAWARVALDVHDDLLTTPLRTPEPQVRSIGIPTWFYGHEPPNVFCTGIAKYFSNALREDGLLARCTAGLVVLEGAAGTVQEVFQSATRLYYAAAGDALPVVVLVGRRHWTQTVPVWPALTALAAGRPMAERVHLVDSVEDAAALVTEAAPA